MQICQIITKMTLLVFGGLQSQICTCTIYCYQVHVRFDTYNLDVRSCDIVFMYWFPGKRKQQGRKAKNSRPAFVQI